MKKLYRAVSLLMSLLLFSVVLTTPVLASVQVSDSQKIMLEDGSYIIITIDYNQPPDGFSLLTKQQTKTGTKNYSFYDSSDELKWVFRVHGAFLYDGVTALATGANYSYDIYDDNWSFVEGSATYSGATATATGSFKRVLFPNSVSVSLTCSPNGVLS